MSSLLHNDESWRGESGAHEDDLVEELSPTLHKEAESDGSSSVKTVLPELAGANTRASLERGRRLRRWGTEVRGLSKKLIPMHRWRVQSWGTLRRPEGWRSVISV